MGISLAACQLLSYPKAHAGQTLIFVMGRTYALLTTCLAGLAVLIAPGAALSVERVGAPALANTTTHNNATATDWRDLSNGHLVYSTGYMDQPYCAVVPAAALGTAAPRWTCVVTLNDAKEGSDGEHSAAFFSDDLGASWHGPVDVFPSLTAKKIDNSYPTVVRANSGRIYVVSSRRG